MKAINTIQKQAKYMNKYLQGKYEWLISTWNDAQNHYKFEIQWDMPINPPK